MKRVIILIAIIAVGVIASALYIKYPPETQQVIAQLDEAGDFTLSKVEVIEEEELPVPKAAVTFSHESGFYSENIELELIAEEGAEIYFTRDGSDPKPENAKKYISPIKLNATPEVCAATIKAVSVKDGEASDIITRSFVMGSGVEERFSEDTLVFVLSSDPYNLYDYEYGICVPGKIYDEYVAAHPGEEIPYNAAGNYYLSGRAGERPMFVEVFESSGKKVIEQAAGVRLSGGYSRVPEQKSFRLIARKEYDPLNGKFKYPFFEGALTETGMPISEYDRVVLRNGANDREFAGVRDELTGQLARDYGYPVTQHARPAAVFLNGEYYGYAWLHENYNEDYLATQFGGSKDKYEIVSNTEQPEEGNERGLNDYAEVVEYFTEKDLTDDKTFEEFCALVDVDNLIQYYCIQIFISNKDWPGNNYKAFRYYPDEGEELVTKFMDGRWRYMLFDVEFGWGLYGETPALKTISDLFSGAHMSGESKLLKALMARDDMREKFINTMCDITTYAFSPTHIKEVLDELIEISDPEQMYALDKRIISSWAHRGTFEDSRNQIRNFADKRYMVVERDMMKNFGILTDKYNISVTGTQGATAYLSTQKTKGGRISGAYYTACGVEIRAEVADGWSFLKWEINGKEYYDTTVRVTSDMAEDGKVYARLYTERAELHGEPLRVSEICTESGAGYVILYNPNSDIAQTDGLYLTDDPLNLQRWEIPKTKIQPLSELVIVMKNNKTQNALGKHQANFSLKKGETLIMSDSDGNILASIEIPELPSGKSLIMQSTGEYKVTYQTIPKKS